MTAETSQLQVNQDGAAAMKAARKRMAGRTIAAAALVLTFGALTHARATGEAVRLGNPQPFATIRKWLAPAQPLQRQQQREMIGGCG